MGRRKGPKVIEKTLNPVFSERFIFTNLQNVQDASLLVTVKDKDAIGAQFLGDKTLTVKDIYVDSLKRKLNADNLFQGNALAYPLDKVSNGTLYMVVSFVVEDFSTAASTLPVPTASSLPPPLRCLCQRPCHRPLYLTSSWVPALRRRAISRRRSTKLWLLPLLKLVRKCSESSAGVRSKALRSRRFMQDCLW